MSRKNFWCLVYARLSANEDLFTQKLAAPRDPAQNIYIIIIRLMRLWGESRQKPDGPKRDKRSRDAERPTLCRRLTAVG